MFWIFTGSAMVRAVAARVAASGFGTWARPCCQPLAQLVAPVASCPCRCRGCARRWRAGRCRSPRSAHRRAAGRPPSRAAACLRRAARRRVRRLSRPEAAAPRSVRSARARPRPAATAPADTCAAPADSRSSCPAAPWICWFAAVTGRAEPVGQGEHLARCGLPTPCGLAARRRAGRGRCRGSRPAAARAGDPVADCSAILASPAATWLGAADASRGSARAALRSPSAAVPEAAGEPGGSGGQLLCPASRPGRRPSPSCVGPGQQSPLAGRELVGAGWRAGRRPSWPCAAPEASCAGPGDRLLSCWWMVAKPLRNVLAACSPTCRASESRTCSVTRSAMVRAR